MRKLLLVLVSISVCLTTQAQNLATSNYQINIDILGVEFSAEKAIGGNFTMTGHLGIGAGFTFESQETFSGRENSFSYVAVPVIGLDTKYYYNLYKRKAKGKSISHNSGNFFAVDMNYYINAPLILHNYDYFRGNLAVGPNWGIRRVFRDKILIETKVGFNVHFFGEDKNDKNAEKIKFSPNIQFKFGIIF